MAIGLAVGALGCAPEPPLTDPVGYLRIGADFEAEARAFAEGLEADGWAVQRPQRGESFAAVVGREAERTVVRVWSRRGLVIAIDAPSPDHWRRAVTLAPPTPEPDLDGDGFEELVIGATDDAAGRTCFAMVRVDGEGFARDVTPTYPDLGGQACVEGFVTGGGPLRAMVVVRFPALARGSVPRVPVPFVPGAAPEGDGAGAVWRSDADAAFLERERTRRRGELAAGRLEPHRAAVELAALAHLAGEDAGAQFAIFDALVGAAADPTTATSRARIEQGWRPPEEPDQVDEGAATTGPTESEPGPGEPR